MPANLLYHDYLDYSARIFPSSEFAVFGAEVMTYAGAAQAANRLAHAFIAAGLQPGDRFAYLSKNSIEMVITFIAASKAGVVIVPLNYRLAPSEWAGIIRDSGSKLLVVQERYVDAVETIRSEVGTVRSFIAIGGARCGWEDYRDWTARQADCAPQIPRNAENALYQMYTSGTTGFPKGVVIGQRSVMANLVQIRYSVETPGMRGMRVLICTPLYHAAGSIMVGGVIGIGASMVIHEDFDPLEVARCLREDRIAGTNFVPSMIQSLLVNVPDLADHDYTHLVSMSYGASPIAEETLRKALAIFKCEFYQSFGLTESTATLTMLNHSDHLAALDGRPELLRSCGRPVMATDIRIVDDEGRDLPCGGVGEIAARGPQLMDGYWNLPDATRRSLQDGWLFTGDVGRIDEDGFVYLLDRKNDVIVSGAENVYPQEVENALYAHPAIAEASVIGIPDEKFGEAVMACVVLKKGAVVQAEELVDFCRGRLGGFKIPRRISFFDQLPRNATGKVQRTKLREPFWSDRGRNVS